MYILSSVLVIYSSSKLRDNIVCHLGRCTPVRHLMSRQKIHPNSSKVEEPSLCTNVLACHRTLCALQHLWNNVCMPSNSSVALNISAKQRSEEEVCHQTSLLVITFVKQIFCGHHNSGHIIIFCVGHQIVLLLWTLVRNKDRRKRYAIEQACWS